uniref:SAM domain-containing protein n=1 Tax=Electrophorus electricus TaxID=8005 RepID=A0A4W4DNU4_ELEEL
MSLIPANQPGCGSDWINQEEAGVRQGVAGAEHAPLSPQGSVASSGSEQTEEQANSRNTFQEDGSGMKDVPTWLKSLRLHKYASLFSQMSYEEMMVLTEQHLESQNVTKGARHKIALSIQKLRERQSVLKSLEKDILEGGNVRNALQELQQIIITPIKACIPPIAVQREAEPGAAPTDKAADPLEEKDTSVESFQSHNPPPCDGESSATPISEGDIPGQFTRVMGKVCTQLLVSRPDEENISCYLQLIEKCLSHEAFTETQKKRLVSWKQQVLKLLRLFPRKAMLDMPMYRQKGWAAYGSNSLPTAGSVSGGMSRRGQRQFPMPPRGAIPPRSMGLMTPGGITGASPRHTLSNPTTLTGQGRQNLWFGNPGGSNSMPSQSRSSVQRTHSLPVHTSPQTMLLFQQPECQVPGTDLEINPTLESLCLSMTEHALGGTANDYKVLTAEQRHEGLLRELQDLAEPERQRERHYARETRDFDKSDTDDENNLQSKVDETEGRTTKEEDDGWAWGQEGMQNRDEARMKEEKRGAKQTKRELEELLAKEIQKKENSKRHSGELEEENLREEPKEKQYEAAKKMEHWKSVRRAQEVVKEEEGEKGEMEEEKKRADEKHEEAKKSEKDKREGTKMERRNEVRENDLTEIEAKLRRVVAELKELRRG